MGGDGGGYRIDRRKHNPGILLNILKRLCEFVIIINGADLDHREEDRLKPRRAQFFCEVIGLGARAGDEDFHGNQRVDD